MAILDIITVEEICQLPSTTLHVKLAGRVCINLNNNHIFCMMDLPPVLMDLLNHLLKTHGTVMSWNIYQRDDGIVNVNIRFPNLSDFTADSHIIVNIFERSRSVFPQAPIVKKSYFLR